MKKWTDEEVKAKVADMGGWFQDGCVMFASIEAYEEFKLWRWKTPA